MEEKKRQALIAAGYRVGDVQEFLGLSDEEMRLVELRIALSRAVRSRRQASNMTQQQLASKLRSSQSRVAKIESAAGEVSLDLMFRSLFAVGGELTDVAGIAGDSASVGSRRIRRQPIQKQRVRAKARS